MARITSSSNRSKRSTKKPVTKGQNPQRANRQAVSQAKVSSAANRQVTGSAKVTQGRGGSSMKADAQQWQKLNQSASARAGKASEAKPRTPAPGTGNVIKTALEYGDRARKAAAQKGAKAATKAMSRTLAAARTARNIAGVAKVAGPVGVAAAAMAPRRLGDATLRGKPTGNPQGPNVPKRMTRSAVDKGSFDNAFRMARKGGAKTFTWRGKKYNTKLKGEK